MLTQESANVVDAEADALSFETPVEDESRKSRRFARVVFVALTCLLLVSVFYTASPVGDDGRYFTICGLKVFTGLPCPGCGMTHSFCALGKGDVGDAFRFNALGPPLYIVAILVWLRSLFVITGRKLWVARFDSVDHLRIVRWSVVALCLFGIARVAYILIWQPALFHGSPLGRLIQAWMS